MKLPQFITLVLIIVVAWGSLFITSISQNQKTSELIKQEHSKNIQILKAIPEDSKDYLACLLAINPAGNLQSQKQACFNSTPEMK